MSTSFFLSKRALYSDANTTTEVMITAYTHFAKMVLALIGKKYSISAFIASFHARPATRPSAAII